jgi:hypothetical protein
MVLSDVSTTQSSAAPGGVPQQPVFGDSGGRTYGQHQMAMWLLTISERRLLKDGDQREQESSTTTFHLLEASDEIRRIDPERPGQSSDVFKRRIALTRFQTADVRPVDPRFEGECLLREAALQTAASNPIAELLLSRGSTLACSSHIII